jgi:hypothetical protein
MAAYSSRRATMAQQDITSTDITSGMELSMRTLLLISVVAALAACSDKDSSTAPEQNRALPVSAATSSPQVQNGQGGKPGAGGGFTTVTVVKTSEIQLPGGAIAQTAVCPAGSTVVGGGYEFTNEGNPNAVPHVTQSYPVGSSGWWVRVTDWATGSWPVAFYVYALCAS